MHVSSSLRAGFRFPSSGTGISDRAHSLRLLLPVALALTTILYRFESYLIIFCLSLLSMTCYVLRIASPFIRVPHAFLASSLSPKPIKLVYFCLFPP